MTKLRQASWTVIPGLNYLINGTVNNWNFFVRIAVDAYNDSQVETLTASSWPSRSLSQDRSNYVLQHFESKRWGSEFEPFQSLAS